MPIDEDEWNELEPVEPLQDQILSTFEENPDTAYSVEDVDWERGVVDPEEDDKSRSGHELVAYEVTRQVMDQVYREQTRTICDQLVYEGDLEKRADRDEGVDYYRLDRS